MQGAWEFLQEFAPFASPLRVNWDVKMLKSKKLSVKLPRKPTEEFDEFYDDDFEDFDFGVGDGDHIDVSFEKGFDGFCGDGKSLQLENILDGFNFAAQFAL